MGRQLVVLARHNASLFEAAVAALDSPHVRRMYGRLFACVGGMDALLDVCVLWRGGHEGEMHNPHGLAARCVAHGGFGLFESVVLERGTPTQRAACRLVRSHQTALPHIIGRLHARITDDASKADVLFFSAHRAKGLGWHSVYLCPDFMAGSLKPTTARFVAQQSTHTPLSLLSRAQLWPRVFAMLERNLDDEANLLYVAMTRAKRMLFVSVRVSLWLMEAGVDFAW